MNTSTARSAFPWKTLFALLIFLAPPGSVSAFTGEDADAIIDAYITSYYRVNNEGHAFFLQRTNHPANPDYFWEPAEKIELMIDVYERSGREDHLELVKNLLAGFIGRWGTNWQSNVYNDDIAWAVIAFTRAYNHTGDNNYLNIARQNYDLMFERAWSDTLGGGLYWRQSDRQSKNTAVNGPAAIAAYLLYEALDDEKYLEIAHRIYDWTREVLFDPETGRVFDHMHINGTLDAVTLTYNQGTFLGAAHFLGHLDDALAAANFSRDVDRGTRRGILPEYAASGDLAGFNAILLRWLSRFMKDRGLEDEYLDWFQFMARRAWENRRPLDDLSWPLWGQPTPLGTLHSFGGTASVAALQVAPPPETTRIQPYSPSWHPTDLRAWSPEDDRDAPFNRATVPLAQRISHNAFNPNANARPDEARVLLLARFGPSAGAYPQGGYHEEIYAFSHWQYVDTLVYWGGSPLEGVIVAPTAAVIDAAHRNGVPVLGSIAFPASEYLGKFEWVSDLTSHEDGRFPVADKLIQAAEYYGFDGWLVRQQTGGASARTAHAMNNFIRYLRENSSLKIVWFDSMDRFGNTQSHSTFDERNETFLINDGPVAHAMTLDDAWRGGGANAANLLASRQRALDLGIDPYDIHAGVDLRNSGYTSNVNWARLFPDQQPHNLSLALYETDWTLRLASDMDDFQSRESRLWSGPNHDPSNTETSQNWRGISHYIPAVSPVTELPFVTHFNRGYGSRFAVDGNVVRDGPWNNLSLQDVLPAWRWIVDTEEADISIDFDMEQPYFGGASLRVTGDLAGPAEIPLYPAAIPVSGDTQLEVVFKRNQGRLSNALEIGLAFDDNLEHFEYFDLENFGGSSWTAHTFDLGKFAGRTIALVKLRFGQHAVNHNYDLHLGRLAIYEKTTTPPAPPSEVKVLQKRSLDWDTMALRLQWTPSVDPVHSYHLYASDADGSRTWLGATPNTTYFVPSARQTGDGLELTIEVQAVGPTFKTSPPVERTIRLLRPPLNEPLTGTIIGTPGSWNNTGNTRENLFDGNFNTHFDSPTADANDAWAGLDLGSRSTRVITAVRFAPRADFEGRMRGGIFQGANRADFADAVTIAVITETPPAGVLTTLQATRHQPFRYVRYLTSHGGHANAAIIEFHGVPGEQFFNSYDAWLRDQGHSPGDEGTGFAESVSGSAVANGVRYAVPEGIQIAPDFDGARVTAGVRNHPRLSVGLWHSQDLEIWQPAPFDPAEDQSGVADGFIRLETNVSLPGGRSAFFRLTLSQE